MELPINHFKRALREGRPQIGLWSHLCSPISTEILGQCGFDSRGGLRSPGPPPPDR